MHETDAHQEIDGSKRDAVQRLLEWHFSPEQIAATLGLTVEAVLTVDSERDQERRHDESRWRHSRRGE
jgi:hypothetical protein